VHLWDSYEIPLMKDLRLYHSQAESLRTMLLTGETALATFEQAFAAGLGNEDYTAVVKLIAPSLVSPSKSKNEV